MTPSYARRLRQAIGWPGTERKTPGLPRHATPEGEDISTAYARLNLAEALRHQEAVNIDAAEVASDELLAELNREALTSVRDWAQEQLDALTVAEGREQKVARIALLRRVEVEASLVFEPDGAGVVLQVFTVGVDERLGNTEVQRRRARRIREDGLGRERLRDLVEVEPVHAAGVGRQEQIPAVAVLRDIQLDAVIAAEEQGVRLVAAVSQRGHAPPNLLQQVRACAADCRGRRVERRHCRSVEGVGQSAGHLGAEEGG